MIPTMKISSKLPGICAGLGLLASGCSTGVNFISADQLAPGELEEEQLREETFTPTLNLLTGEKLVYDVNWMGISVGQVEVENHGIEEVDGVEAYHVTTVTRANDFLANFFNIEDTVHSWILPGSGCPVRFEKVIKEGHYTKHQRIVYDQENLRAVYTRPDREKDEPYGFDISPCTQDVLSLLFWVRNQPFRLGDILSTRVNADKKNWDVEIEVVERGAFDTGPLERVKVYRLEPRATHEGSPLKKGTMSAWVTSDYRHVPVAFQVEAKIVGNINAVISEAVLPPLPVEPVVSVEEVYDIMEIYDPDQWIRGEAQTDNFLRGAALRALIFDPPPGENGGGDE